MVFICSLCARFYKSSHELFVFIQSLSFRVYLERLIVKFADYYVSYKGLLYSISNRRFIRDSIPPLFLLNTVINSFILLPSL